MQQDLEDSDFTLHSRCKQAFECILDLNLSVPDLDRACSSNSLLVWKVLIMDDFAQDVVSPLLHLGDLRHHNVTLHLQLHAQRPPLHNVTAVYVMLPTPANIKRLEEDCRGNLYDLFQLNFLEPLGEESMEVLAKAVAADINRLHRVYDHCLSFLVLEPKLFITMGPDFRHWNDRRTTDSEVEDFFSSTAHRLFTVLRTLKVLPIIRSGPGFSEGIAPRVAELCAAAASEETHPSRPLLLIVDRSIDLTVMLHHPWTYQALIYDLLEGALNKVVLKTGAAQPKVYELNPYRDDFWAGNSTNSFETVLQAVDQHVKAWKAKYESMGSNLTAAMDSMPEITEKKDQLDMHASIATSLVDQVKRRKLDKFNSLEEGIMKNQFDSRLLQSLLEETEAKDRERALVIALMKQAITGPQALAFGLSSDLKRYLDSELLPKDDSERQSSFSYLSNIAEKMKGRFQQLYDDGFMLGLTQLLDRALSHKASELGYYDPKHMNSKQVYKRQFNEAIVFVVGGGSYAEYHNLMKYAEKTGKRIVYGATDMPHPEEFLEQIRALASG